MSSDPRDYKLDLQSLPVSDPPERGAPPSRPFISVQFACCNVYMRVYRSADGGSYNARCPRCGRGMRFVVAAGGTSQRHFVVE